MSENPVDFCNHLALAVKKRQKTVTFKPLNRSQAAAHVAGQSVVCPYGQVGDVLWVREPAGTSNKLLVYQCDYATRDGYKAPLALPDDFETVPPIERNQARLLLTVQAISIVALQTVDEAAATLAGTIPSEGRATFLQEFKAQWDEAYRQQAWNTNPLCWRVSYVLQ
jgi:hypothetical protein